MKLISCERCGLVYDQDKMKFPEVYDGDYEVIEGNSEWDGDDYVAITDCVCGCNIREEK